MYIIVGLGNPTREYEHTRHNAGFEAVDAVADAYRVMMGENRHRAVLGKGYIGGQKVILAKPQTYMNLSGESVRALVDYYKIDETCQLIILYDDVSLKPGQLRIRRKGSAGGHNGIKNIIQHLGHDEFLRIKIGVGEKPKNRDLADYVLSRFTAEDAGLMKDAFERAAKAVETIITDGVDAAMNSYNAVIQSRETES